MIAPSELRTLGQYHTGWTQYRTGGLEYGHPYHLKCAAQIVCQSSKKKLRNGPQVGVIVEFAKCTYTILVTYNH